jgi:hypothetical protein
MVMVMMVAVVLMLAVVVVIVVVIVVWLSLLAGVLIPFLPSFLPSPSLAVVMVV